MATQFSENSLHSMLYISRWHHDYDQELACLCPQAGTAVRHMKFRLTG